MQINEKNVVVTPIARPKKITGTRLGAILGVNEWKTPFQAWCEITRTYEPEFTGNKYTEAGKVIESKIVDFLKENYFLNDVKMPEDVYGENFFDETRGDFYKDVKRFGGMWDAISFTDKLVIECKTSQIENYAKWQNSDIPEYYRLQAGLYAYLMGYDDVIVACAFLDEAKGDYVHPEDYKCSFENTIVRKFKVSDTYDFDKIVHKCNEWWDQYVATGISPEFDAKKDKEYLDGIKTNHIDTSDINEVIARAESIAKELNEVYKSIADKEKLLKQCEDEIKAYATKNFKDTDDRVVLTGKDYIYTVSKTVKKDLDKTAISKVIDIKDYMKESVSYRLTKKEVK